jgi:hypothetical protein
VTSRGVWSGPMLQGPGQPTSRSSEAPACQQIAASSEEPPQAGSRRMAACTAERPARPLRRLCPVRCIFVVFIVFVVVSPTPRPVTAATADRRPAGARRSCLRRQPDLPADCPHVGDRLPRAAPRPLYFSLFPLFLAPSPATAGGGTGGAPAGSAGALSVSAGTPGASGEGAGRAAGSPPGNEMRACHSRWRKGSACLAGCAVAIGKDTAGRLRIAPALLIHCFHCFRLPDRLVAARACITQQMNARPGQSRSAQRGWLARFDRARPGVGARPLRIRALCAETRPRWIAGAQGCQTNGVRCGTARCPLLRRATGTDDKGPRRKPAAGAPGIAEIRHRSIDIHCSSLFPRGITHRPGHQGHLIGHVHDVKQHHNSEYTTSRFQSRSGQYFSSEGMPSAAQQLTGARRYRGARGLSAEVRLQFSFEPRVSRREAHRCSRPSFEAGANAPAPQDDAAACCCRRKAARRHGPGCHLATSLRRSLDLVGRASKADALSDRGALYRRGNAFADRALPVETLSGSGSRQSRWRP